MREKTRRSSVKYFKDGAEVSEPKLRKKSGKVVRLTFLLEVVDVEVRDDEVALLLDAILVVLAQTAREHHNDFLFSCGTK